MYPVVQKMSQELFIITGASQGYGQSIAVEISKAKPNIHLLLTGRNIQGCEDTKRIVEKNTSTCIIDVCGLDLSNLDDLDKGLNQLFKKVFILVDVNLINCINIKINR
jgi:short-subunit dehydrogenase